METKNVMMKVIVTEAQSCAANITAALVNLEADFQLSGNAESMWLYTARYNARRLVSTLDSLDDFEISFRKGGNMAIKATKKTSNAELISNILHDQYAFSVAHLRQTQSRHDRIRHNIGELFRRLGETYDPEAGDLLYYI